MNPDRILNNKKGKGRVKFQAILGMNKNDFEYPKQKSELQGPIPVTV